MILPSNEILHVQILHNQHASRPEAEPGKRGGRGAPPRREGEARAESSGVASGEARKPSSTPPKTCSKASRAKPRGLSAEAKLGAGAAGASAHGSIRHSKRVQT